MQSSEEDLKKYVYSIVPDYSYIDYFDREYALGNLNNLKKKDSDDNPICVMHLTNEFELKGRRCLLISPTELEKNQPSLDANDTTVFMRLNDYDGKYMYAVIRDDDDAFAASSMTIKFNSWETTDGLDVDYVMELRF